MENTVTISLNEYDWLRRQKEELIKEKENKTHYVSISVNRGIITYSNINPDDDSQLSLKLKDITERIQREIELLRVDPSTLKNENEKLKNIPKWIINIFNK